ncbi:hypothetical protein [Aliiroseovarius sp. PrR006]|uniref:hypothetical protein n=1 Tax=Aliiroseovarius sp. PrR006 TaxID=2706883 RepID=UPI0013CF4A46|nr:hypothetical protein [Aliiroseovarius sp. PrR006]NDW52247.1 hypothetical protein [Aliiroseovarius sp. PrR006]
MQPHSKILSLGPAKDVAFLDTTSEREVFMPCSAFEQLTEKQIADLDLDVVISMFVCGSLDCLEISQRLARAGFTGRYYVLVPDLPNPQIIIDDITRSCPDIDIQIVTSPPSLENADQ